jgi:hypothetical protein
VTTAARQNPSLTSRHGPFEGNLGVIETGSDGSCGSSGCLAGDPVNNPLSGEVHPDHFVIRGRTPPTQPAIKPDRIEPQPPHVILLLAPQRFVRREAHKGLRNLLTRGATQKAFRRELKGG